MAEKVKRPKLEYQTTRGERLSFGIFGIGLNLFFVLVGYFLNQFYLYDVAVPASIIGVIFLVVKIWDGINDPIFGVLVDKARLKSGKYLPWMRIATIFLPIIAAALFFVPLDAPMWLKAAFLLVVYMLYDAASTMTEVPYFAITTAMTSDTKERSSIITLSKFIGSLPVVVVLFVPALYTAIGWRLTAVIFAAVALLSMLPGCFKLRERNVVRSENPPKVKDLFSYLKSNKYLIIFFTSAILYGLANTATSMSNQFAISCLGSDSYLVPIMIFTFLPGFAAMFVTNLLLRRFDKIQLLYFALISTGIICVAMYFIGYENFTVFLILSAVRGFTTAMHTMLFFLFTPDLSEYGTYVTGVHAEGAAFSIQSFASKVLAAIASAVSMFMLAYYGFVEGSTVQTAEVQHGIWVLVSVFPAIGIVLQMAVIAIFYKLRDKDVAIMTKANYGEISFEEADRLLGGKFPRNAQPNSQGS